VTRAADAQLDPVKEAAAAKNLSWSMSQIAVHERHRRNRHRGAVVWFTGLSGSGKSTIATTLERRLFDRGLQVFVLGGDPWRSSSSICGLRSVSHLDARRSCIFQVRPITVCLV
jgi:putative protein kinase ArgK-like GTPase of G3E family